MKGLPRSRSRGRPEVNPIQKLRIAIDETMQFTGITTTVVRQEVVIGDFPEGNILLLGATGYVGLTGPTSADLSDTFAGDFSVGSAPNADTSLSGSEVDILPATALGPATAEAIALTRAANATAVMLDNTDGSLEVNLNVLIDADNITNAVAVDIAVQGFVDIAYIVLGDD
jgi:hypothetical protein